MRAQAADECLTNALHCVEVAKHAHTLVDRSDFLAFAEAWSKLANDMTTATVLSHLSMR